MPKYVASKSLTEPLAWQNSYLLKRDVRPNMIVSLLLPVRV